MTREARSIGGHIFPVAWARGIHAISVFVGLAAGLALLHQFGLRLNLTPSEPIGLWRIAPLDRQALAGARVFICPPQRADMRESRRRGYLRPGPCPGGYAPLIKSVVATAGQTIKLSGGVVIDGALLEQSRPMAADGRGRPLTAWPGGPVPAGQVFLHSPFEASFDSRYFGPVPASGILGLAREVATYAP